MKKEKNIRKQNNVKDFHFGSEKKGQNKPKIDFIKHNSVLCLPFTIKIHFIFMGFAVAMVSVGFGC